GEKAGPTTLVRTPMRTIWNGSISFGLVNIPIGLALATQRTDVAFRTLHRECGTPIKQKRWCPFHERDVEPDELVKGWEVAKGEPLPDPPAGRHARARDIVRRRGRALQGGDRGGGRGDRRTRGRARAGGAGDPEPRGRVGRLGLRERVPARPARDARRKARGR